MNLSVSLKRKSAKNTNTFFHTKVTKNTKNISNLVRVWKSEVKGGYLAIFSGAVTTQTTGGKNLSVSLKRKSAKNTNTSFHTKVTKNTKNISNLVRVWKSQLTGGFLAILVVR